MSERLKEKSWKENEEKEKVHVETPLLEERAHGRSLAWTTEKMTDVRGSLGPAPGLQRVESHPSLYLGELPCSWLRSSSWQAMQRVAGTERGAFLRWSLLLLAMAALAALLLVTSVEGRSAKMQWPRFAYCISRKAGPLLATPSGRCASRKMRGQFNAMKAANCVNCDKYEPPQP
ncbi:hypothetical protein HPB51_005722 [Rhipicephalus microplus]|uniref:Uncharacterized protein n=1 Tax=Rhipicephalus microplus TaxID=6941 RepID=A0A9J6DG05_RHIMP|nr:hypothetical protein HPB51_005722 [Rhipicephalus microplus]